MSNNIHSFNSPNQSRNRDNYFNPNTQNNQNENRNFFRTIFPYFKFLSFSFLIIIFNIVIYLTELFMNYEIYPDWNCCLYKMGAKYTPAIKFDLHFHRLFIPIILHASFTHLIMNTISLIFLTTFAENFLGTLKFSILYILSGFYASLLSAVINVENLSVGASGSIMGLTGFYIVYYVMNYRVLTENDKKFFYFFMVITVMNLFQTTTDKGEIVDMFGHIGGFIGGLCMTVILYGNEKINFDDQIALFRKLKIISSVIYILTAIIMMVSIFVIKMEENLLSLYC